MKLKYERIRSEILLEAEKLVNGDREETHGDASNNFDAIAALWSVWLGVSIDPRDIPMMMALFKIARAKSRPGNKDNYIDVAGYIALAAEEIGAFMVDDDEEEKT